MARLGRNRRSGRYDRDALYDGRAGRQGIASEKTAGVRCGRLVYGRKTALKLPDELIGNESEKRI
jgi:hypothetical protein